MNTIPSPSPFAAGAWMLSRSTTTITIIELSDRGEEVHDILHDEIISKVVEGY